MSSTISDTAHVGVRVAVLGLAGIVLSGCGARVDAAGASALQESASVRRGEFVREIILTGELEAVRSLSVKAPQTSVFQMQIRFMAEEGLLVRRGDPLVDFDNSALADQSLDLEAQILDAETQVLAKESELSSALKDLEIELAEKEYVHRVARLHADIDSDIVSRRDYQERQLELSRAAEDLEETRRRVVATGERGRADLDVLLIQRDKLKHDQDLVLQDLDLLSIKAPADGLVVYEERPQSTARFQPGDSCWPGQAVLSLPDLSEMKVRFSVNEVDARLLRTGMEVRVDMDAYPGETLAGRIVEIPSMAVKRSDDSKVRIFNVIADLEETWAERMKPGMSVRGRVVVERLDDAPMVPRTLVFFDGAAYRLLPNGAARGTAARMTDDRRDAPVVHPVSRNATHYVLDDERDAEALARLGIEAAVPVPAESAPRGAGSSS